MLVCIRASARRRRCFETSKSRCALLKPSSVAISLYYDAPTHVWYHQLCNHTVVATTELSDDETFQDTLSHHCQHTLGFAVYVDRFGNPHLRRRHLYRWTHCNQSCLGNDWPRMAHPRSPKLRATAVAIPINPPSRGNVPLWQYRLVVRYAALTICCQRIIRAMS